MHFSAEFILYELLLIFTTLAAIYQWRILNIPDKWIAGLLLITLIQEGIAGILSAFSISNVYTYHFYTPIEVFFIINYFARATRINHASRFGLFFGSIAVILSILNTAFIQKLSQFNSYYLLLEGIIIICFSLFSFYKLLIREDITPKKMAVFWITCCFLFYWCLTFVNLGMYAAVIGTNGILATIIKGTLYYANLLFYLAIAIVFLRYKKLVPSGE